MTLKKVSPPIFVTKSVLPDKAEYVKYLDKIWESGWLTNNGPLVKELETQLKNHLAVPNLLFVSNGTTALQLAIKSLALSGEIITTPYSYVASTSSILWQNCTAVFADVAENSFCIDVKKIEEKITSNTCAILATHVYGIPCDVEGIEKLAKEYGLKVIYDAAHAFGVEYKGKSLYSYGDISATSFHATKVYHTIEGGAIITNDKDLSDKIELTRAFGHRADDHFHLGINGKNSEFHAAIGLCNLKTIDSTIARRKEKFELYKSNLKGGNLKTLDIPRQVRYNYGYFPVVFENMTQMMAVKQALEADLIYPRRYFYPSLNTLSYVNSNPCPVSEKLSETVLCLPFYQDLDVESILRISAIIHQTLCNG